MHNPYNTMEDIPSTQTAAVLHATKSPYVIETEAAVPELRSDDEVLVKAQVIGLNPIDWKAPDFGFGIPALPYIAGRELVGRIVRTARTDSRFQPGDQVIVISTDYRDGRKAAYQEYVVAQACNAVRLPRALPARAGATVGVAFVAAALALGVCLGVDFGTVAGGPDLRALVRTAALSRPLPDDVRDECAGARLREGERARPGDWLVVGGGSSTTAGVALQLARLAGLRVALVVDAAKHGLRLAAHAALRPDLVVDAHDPGRAVAILGRSLGRGGGGGGGRPRPRFAIDTRGRDSAAVLGRALGPCPPKDEAGSPRLTPPATPTGDKTSRAHLVGLAGLPREPESIDLVYHTVPIKLYHEVPEVGEALSLWLERLLETGLLTTPDIVTVEEGFQGINRGLDRMRKGEISGGKAIVVLDESLTYFNQEVPS